ncbi:MAG: hypothetical protein A3J75_01005 [Acidobacteria bacterium RBG_16_68_9]|nr:MAG: hypothetical protein A3J75_01005 [Acidobacteria bacterium RBG_16_68_9]
MPTQEVPCAADLTPLLRGSGRGARAVVLDGRGADSWGDGRAVYADTPRATLGVYASGWGEWRNGETLRWSRGAPIEQWRRFLAEAPALLPAPRDDDAAGFLTVLSYDLKHWIERLPRRHAWPPGPVLYCALYDWSCWTDYRARRAWVSAATPAALEQRLAAVAAGTVASKLPAAEHGRSRLRPRIGKEAYRRMIAAALEYIAAGDVYQVNLAQQFTAAGNLADGVPLFARLQQDYPMPFAAYVDGGDFVAVSNSPECFLRVDGDLVSTFPIKGTRAAGNGRGDPLAHADGLAQSPKEQAEHIMIVDLERNDLGRVCRTGSVEVAELAKVRSYPLLQHMISHVRGRLRPDTSLPELIRATFPGGSITGAPKIRAMQIIEELEPQPRGLYTGTIGWTDLHGNSRFNLAIRTAVLTTGGLTYAAGGGIVADSDAEREYAETLLKSEAFFRAWAAVEDPRLSPKVSIQSFAVRDLNLPPLAKGD